MNKRKLISSTVTGVLVIAILVLKFVGMTNFGNPATINMDGTAVKVNSDLVSDVLGQGYDLKLLDKFVVSMKNIPSKSYVERVAKINKGDTEYATISVANVSKNYAAIETCKVIAIQFKYNARKGDNLYTDTEVDGFNPKGMTKDEVKSKISKKKIKKDEDKKLRIEDGDYYYEYTFDDKGKVDTVEVGIPGDKVATSTK